MKTYTKTMAVATGLACAAMASQAALTTEGTAGSVAETAPTTLPAGDFVQTLSSAFNTGGYTGSLNSWAIKAGDDSLATTLGFTGITFVFQVTPTGGNKVGSITLNGFTAGTTLGFGYLATSTAADPSNWSQDPTGFIKVNWVPDPPGYTTTGDFLYIYTDLLTTGQVTDSVQDGLSATPAGLSPIPEPTTVLAGALMLLPLGISAVRSLRKDRSA
jgi:hypothetical protein